MSAKLVLALLCLHAIASAQETVTFVGTINDLWSEPENWFPFPPRPTDHVVLNRNNCSIGQQPPTGIILDVDATVQSLTIFGFIPSGHNKGCAMTLVVQGTVLQAATLDVLPTAKVLLFNGTILASGEATFSNRSYISGTGVLSASSITLYHSVVYPGTFYDRCAVCAPEMREWLYGDIVLRSPSILMQSSFISLQQRPVSNSMAGRKFPGLPYGSVNVEGLLTNQGSVIVLVNLTCDSGGVEVVCVDSSWPARADVMTWNQVPRGDPFFCG